MATAAARPIYVDQSYTGSAENGTLANPYKTIGAAAAVAGPGDVVYVRAGTYRETVTPAVSGTTGAPITFQPYEGETVTISGADLVTGWSPAAGLDNTWVADVPAGFNSLIGQNEQVFVDGVMIHLARFPNFGDITNLSYPIKLRSDRLVGNPVRTGLKDPYGRDIFDITFEDDELLTQHVDWTGAMIQMNELATNPARNASGNEVWQDLFFQPKSFRVISHAGNRITYRNDNGDFAGNAAVSGAAYFLFDKQDAIDSNGEWWLDKSVSPHKLYVRTPDGSDPAGHEVEFKVRDWAFNLDPGAFRSPAPAGNARSYITVKGFKLFACGVTTDRDAAYGGATDIQYPWRGASSYAESHHVVLSDLDIRYVSHFYSLRGDSYFTWEQTGGVILSGSDLVMQNCKIAYSAGNGITVLGRRNRVFNNVIHDVGYADVETGFISTGTTAPSFDHEISYNTCYNASRMGFGIRNLKNSDPGSRIARIHHNRISNYGIQAIQDIGAMYNAYQDGNNLRIDHNVIHGDNGRPIGAGIYIDYGKGYIFDHNVVYDAGAPLKYNNNATIVNSYAYNNVLISSDNGPRGYVNDGPGTDEGLVLRNNITNGIFKTGGRATTSNNLFNAPDTLFVNAAGGDYQLRPTAAAAIDKGVGVEPYNDPIAGAAPDLGAFEFGKPAPEVGSIGAYTPELTSIKVTPDFVKLPIGATQSFSAVALDQYEGYVEPQPAFAWSVVGSGNITPDALYTAPGTAGTDTVKATSGGISGRVAVQVQDIFVQVTQENNADPADFTTATTISGSDWVHFGRNDPGGTDRKANGGGQIFGYNTLGIFNPGASPQSTYYVSRRPITWTDGTPTASNVGNDAIAKSCVFVNSGVGGGFSLSAPSSPSLRTLTLYVGGSKMVGAVTVKLDDGNSQTILYTDTLGKITQGDVIGQAREIGPFDRRITINYRTPEKARILVSWTMAQAEIGGGVAALNGATLSFSDSVRVLTSVRVTPDSASVDLGLTKPFTAVAYDQDDAPLKVQPAFSWTVSGGGTIDDAGTFTAGNAVGGPFAVTARTGNVSDEAGVRVVDQAARIVRTPTEPLLDGTAEALWEKAPRYALGNNLSGGTAPLDPADLSGTYRALYDTTHLYVLFEVTDDNVSVDGGPWYDNDSPELYIDRGNKKREGYQADDFQWAFLADGTGIIESKHNNTAGAAYVAKPTAGGYTLEIKLPWTALGGFPANRALGFDAHVNDDDAGGGRDGKVSWWSVQDNVWISPTHMGVAKLTVPVTPIDTTDLLLYLPFDETTGTAAADLSGKGNAGTLRDGAAFAPDGKLQGAVRFGGTGGVVTVAPSPTLNPAAAITVSAWVNANAWTGTREILVKGAKHQYRLAVEKGNIRFSLNGVGSVTATAPSLRAWHLLTGTYDGSVLKLYVDGTLVAATSKAGRIVASAEGLSIGSRSGTANHFDGLVDEARIYRRALTAAEVARFASPAARRVAGWAAAEDDLRYYPVPASDWLTVTHSLQADGPVHLRITDVLSREVHAETKAGRQGRNQYRVRVGHLKDGVYLLHVGRDGRPEVKQIVVRH